MKKYILLLAAIVLAAAAAIVLPPLFGNETKEPLLADIVQDGRTIRTVDLANAPDEEFVVEYKGAPHAGMNRIRIEKGEIRVTEADCPDHICIGSGKLRRNGPPIVCLPHKLVIRYREAGGIDGTAR